MCNFAPERTITNRGRPAEGPPKEAKPTMKKSNLLLLAALALTAPTHAQVAANRSATLNVTPSTKYQYIDGFGGTGMNGQWGDVYTQAKVQKLWGTDDKAVGLNIMRIRINPNEGNWGEYGNPIRWARAQRPDLQVFATPWTPPKKYKTQNTEKYQNDFGTWVWPLVEYAWGGQGSNGGAIDPAHYDDYADFLERYRQTMEQKGAPIDIISIQNECDYTPTATTNGVEQASYESCIYSPKEMAAMVKAARAKIDPACKVMGPETFGWGQHTYNNTLVGMKDATDNIDLWGNHLYGTNDYSFIQTVTKKTGKHMWMTEFLIDYADGYDGAFTAEYAMVESIEKALQSGYNAYIYYNMVNDFFACNHGGSDTELWKRAYVFSHYARYATGKTRVKTTLNDTNGKLVGGSAYISQGGDTITIFLLNTSATDTYNVTVGLPFVPGNIQQVATSEAVNRLVTDVTATAGNGTVRPRLTLLPGVFYTFQFTQDEAVIDPDEQQVAASPKQDNQANPISPTDFMADPTAIEHDGRLYVYATNDQQQFDYSGGIFSNDYSKITSLRCLSTADLVNWTDHGTIDVKAAAPWIATSWAPSVISRTEGDGLTHFYLYFTNNASGIGVLTATSPTGPWTDPLGHALIDGRTAGIGTISNIIDPGAAINPATGEAYLTFGGGNVTGTDLQPGNARIVKLGSDLISLDSDIKAISAPCHFEANELNYIGSRWVFSYCTRWSIASNWSTYSSKTAPTPAAIVYLTTTNPLEDRWTYQGEMLPNPGRLGYPYGNNHTHLQKFGSAWYLLYHTQWLEDQRGFSGGYRNLQMNRTTVVEASAKVGALTATTASLAGSGQLNSALPNPYDEQSGKMAANRAKGWWLVRGVNFANGDRTAQSLVVHVKGSGTLSVRTGSLEAEPVATIRFSAAGADTSVSSQSDGQTTEGEQVLAADLTEPLSTLQQYLYFTLDGTDAADEPDVLTWQFSTLPAVEAVGIEVPNMARTAKTTAPTYFTPAGTRLQTPQRGINIVRRPDGTVVKVLVK